MIRSFADRGTEDVYYGRRSKLARKVCPERLHRLAGRKLDLLDSVVELDELRVPPGNKLETLKGDRAGQYSIRINQQYRICFTWSDAGPADVEIADYH
ncbi:MAG: type II toxin-antitoxin system RelE/ParE family toxin [Gemmatimonadota bacterium]|nr:MAG: type II toxin-antitoxin system RelE/ParE family toxin [Gemmatimonadota bacterium]